MKGSCEDVVKCGDIHAYDGKRIRDITTQFDLEGIAKCYTRAFPHQGPAMAQAFLRHLSIQPQPVERHCLMIVLGPDDVVETRTAIPWLVIPESNQERFPIQWSRLDGPEAKVLTVVCVTGIVEEGKRRTIWNQAVHFADALFIYKAGAK